MSHRSLFSGVAAYYARYRPDYPQELFTRVVQAFGLRGEGRLLDLGCGPGNVALGLAPYVQEVVAVDVNPEMLAAGERLAAEAGVQNITWLEMSAEEIGPQLGTFRLVTLGRSFHWMQREVVLQSAYALLDPGGGIAILGGDARRDWPWWRLVVEGLVRRWKVRERALPHNADNPQERHEQVLRRSAFQGVQGGSVRSDATLTLEQVLGEVYSHSNSKPELFGENRGRFEEEVRRVLGMLEPTGLFPTERVFDYLFAHKP